MSGFDFERPKPLRDDLLAPFGNAVGCLLLLVGFPAWIGVCHWWPA